MNNIRIEVFSEKESEEIIKKLSRVFNIVKVSKLYKKRDANGYYIYLTVENKNLIKVGRQQKFNDHEKEMIKMYRLQGKTIEELAESFNCSVGLIHKIIKE